VYRILVATDGSDHSKKVVEKALPLAEAVGAEVTVMTAVGEYVFSPRVSMQFSDDNWSRIRNQLQEEAEEIVNEAAKAFREKGLKVNTELVIGRQAPADAICELASKGQYDLVILGSRGLRGIKEAFLGSVSNKVAHCSNVNVLIVK
jgi:nucleotide-binding universal stress UspA family protein